MHSWLLWANDNGASVCPPSKTTTAYKCIAEIESFLVNILLYIIIDAKSAHSLLNCVYQTYKYRTMHSINTAVMRPCTDRIKRMLYEYFIYHQWQYYSVMANSILTAHKTTIFFFVQWFVSLIHGVLNLSGMMTTIASNSTFTNIAKWKWNHVQELSWFIYW